MKKLTLLLPVVLGLSACNNLPLEPEVLLTIKSVDFPAEVTAGATMNVVVEVQVGGCTRFNRLTATRTASTLSIQAIGNQGTGACTALIGWEKHTYTDPGTPARTNPFELIINNQSWGKVQVK